jgi:hypothetical protein
MISRSKAATRDNGAKGALLCPVGLCNGFECSLFQLDGLYSELEHYVTRFYFEEPFHLFDGRSPRWKRS